MKTERKFTRNYGSLQKIESTPSVQNDHLGTEELSVTENESSWEEAESNRQDILKHNYETGKGRLIWKRKCKNCGKEFYTICYFRKYCHLSDCRSIASKKRNEQRKLEHFSEHTCSVCSGSFVSKRNDAKFCSNACRQKAYRSKASK